jgi:hypothetical protein
MMFGPCPLGTQVSYDDGDVEVLALKKERWEFIAEVFPLCLNLMQLYVSSFLFVIHLSSCRNKTLILMWHLICKKNNFCV